MIASLPASLLPNQLPNRSDRLDFVGRAAVQQSPNSKVAGASKLWLNVRSSPCLATHSPLSPAILPSKRRGRVPPPPPLFGRLVLALCAHFGLLSAIAQHRWSGPSNRPHSALPTRARPTASDWARPVAAFSATKPNDPTKAACLFIRQTDFCRFYVLKSATTSLTTIVVPGGLLNTRVFCQQCGQGAGSWNPTRPLTHATHARTQKRVPFSCRCALDNEGKPVDTPAHISFSGDLKPHALSANASFPRAIFFPVLLPDLGRRELATHERTKRGDVLDSRHHG